MTALSPRSDAGGTLHCPSPSSFHRRGFHIHKELERDHRLLELQRSLSRSPSKSPILLTTSTSSSPSPSSPLSPSRNDARIKILSTSISAPSELQVPSALSTPQHPGSRKTRISSRRQSPLRNPRFTITPKSPRKRTLQESSDNGNSGTRSSRSSSEDQENRTAGSLSPDRDSVYDGALKQTNATSNSIGHAPPRATARFELGRGRSWGAKSSPLKRSERSDGLMNIDNAHMGSPSAKRRSLHGGVLNSDFDIFEQAGRLDSQTDTQMSDLIFDSDHVVSRDQPSPMISRSSSLRPTTVQQRNEKPSLVRSRANPDIAAEMATPGYAQSRNRARQSLDSALLPIPRDSPFSSQGSLPNASAHPIPQSTGSSQAMLNPRLPARHPLSRTISQSTSTSSMAEDSPTHIPIRQPEQRRPQFNFSKTMPSGTSRPLSRDGTFHSQDSSGTSFATPENYKLVKPHAAAFGSTGLISKRTRNTEGSRPNFGASTSTMPDTPCKRHSIADIPSPSTTAHDEIFPRGHHKGVSFGEPSTPFNPKKYHTTPASFGKGVNIFGSQSSKRLQRKDSFFGFSDVEDDSQSPSGKVESQSSAEYDIPPTPSRQLRSRLNDPPSPFLAGKWREGLGSLTLELAFGSGDPTAAPSQFCKSFSISRPEVNADGDSDYQMEDLPSVGLRLEHFSSVPRSFTYSRLLRNSKSPTPLNRAAFTAPAYLARRKQAKPSPLSPASPPESRTYRLSPRTPRDHMLPPDPSGLSISQHGDEQIKSLDSLTSSASILPPATPTASKEYFALSNRSLLGATPSHKPALIEIDSTLTSRFHDVQVLGTGEFSQVFRVSGKRILNQTGIVPRGAEARLSLPDQKWAVKKSRKAFMGPRDRQRKMKEVEILKALGKSDHTVEFIDSWEHRGHLYIQTEFCEEGSLDMFLDIKGRNARLDDFRIWKILEDLTLGLKHIHDSGFIHLDLKPANILIAFEGDLKIADFGMATSWPAQSGIEAEGDREYIGPEILQGEFDKPADIFALGLIILEIAGNVVLPDNGVSWQRLRSGDFSDVPSLTWSSESSHHIIRDNDGNPLSQEGSLENFYGSDEEDDAPRFRRSQSPKPENRIREALARASRDGELAEPPSFMRDPHHPEALDKIMRWMLSPRPSDRPVVDQLLAIGAVQWTRNRRRAGAVTYEGNWGPSDYVLSDDTEMLDV